MSQKVEIDVSAKGVEEARAKVAELMELIEKARSLADDLARAMKELTIETTAIQESKVILPETTVDVITDALEEGFKKR